MGTLYPHHVDVSSKRRGRCHAYTVTQANWETPGFREYHRRMQLFVLLYIEGGSYIQEDEEKWEFVVLCVAFGFSLTSSADALPGLIRYEKRRRRDEAKTPVYHFVGYSSLYQFYCWPDKLRLRLRFVRGATTCS